MKYGYCCAMTVVYVASMIGIGRYGIVELFMRLMLCVESLLCKWLDFVKFFVLCVLLCFFILVKRLFLVKFARCNACARSFVRMMFFLFLGMLIVFIKFLIVFNNDWSVLIWLIVFFLVLVVMKLFIDLSGAESVAIISGVFMLLFKVLDICFLVLFVSFSVFVMSGIGFLVGFFVVVLWRIVCILWIVWYK